MAVYKDQTGKEISLSAVPSRIISLVPSQTELLYDLGLDTAVIGITKFCVHPQQWYKNKERIGGTKSVDTKKIIALQPDLILANKEENTKEQVIELAAHFPVWTSDISNLQQALQMIDAIGAMTATGKKAKEITDQVSIFFQQLTAQQTNIRTAYLIWQNPYMSIGSDTFINDMLSRCGFENIFAAQQRYPFVTIEAIKSLDCQLLLLSSEPFPFQQKHLTELQLQLPSTQIRLVDGEMFSWYGSRLLQAPGYFRALISETGREKINHMH